MTDMEHLIAAIERSEMTVGGKPFASDRVFSGGEGQAAALRAAKVVLQERDELAEALAGVLRRQYEAGLEAMEPSRDPLR